MDIAFGDLDGDGDPDLVTAYVTGIAQNHAYFNTTRQLYAPSPPTTGRSYPLEVWGPPGTLALMLLALRPGHVRVPPFGLFRLDPASTLVFPAMRPIGLPRKTTFPAAVPNLAALRGLWIYTQAVLLDPTRILRSRFTNPFRDQIWESFRHGTQSAIFAHTPNRGP